jgi:hypothetical protein
MLSRDRNGRSQRGFVGRGANYLISRLKRDRPEILSQLQAGEFPSVRQAAIAAGIVTPDTPL